MPDGSFDHRTDRKCDDCEGVSLEDTIVHFGEGLKDVNIAHAKSKGAVISIAIGTKLEVEPAASWVMAPHKRRPVKGKVCIVNLMKTRRDEAADMVIHNFSDKFFELLCRELGVVVLGAACPAGGGDGNEDTTMQPSKRQRRK